MISNKNTLTSYFKTGDIPTQEEFAELINSSLNIVDNTLIPAEAWEGIQEVPTDIYVPLVFDRSLLAIQVLTQVEYDLLGQKIPGVLYLIKEELV